MGIRGRTVRGRLGLDLAVPVFDHFFGEVDIRSLQIFVREVQVLQIFYLEEENVL